MKKFTLTVTGLTRKEYFQACHENGKRIYAILGAMMVLFCGLIIVFTGDASLASILAPAGIYAVVMAGYEVLTRASYKGQLDTLDPPVVYTFEAAMWTVSRGEEHVEVLWRATPKLHRSRDCLFIYNADVSGNLLPKRLMSQEQMEAIRTWFDGSRRQAREYEKKANAAERAKFRAEHPGLRLGRTGPAWGPRKKK